MQHLTVVKGMQIGRIRKGHVIETTLALETCKRQCTWKIGKRIINKNFKFYSYCKIFRLNGKTFIKEN